MKKDNKKKLHLGCGTNILKRYINLDVIKLRGVDVVHDLNKFPYPFKDNIFDEIYGYHIFEHLDNMMKVMEELYRISKPNGVIRMLVPYYHQHGAFRDFQHKSFFTYDIFDFYIKKDKYHFYHKPVFEIVKRELIPAPLGKLVPFKKKFLNYVGMVLGEIVRNIYFELRVIKNEKEKRT